MMRRINCYYLVSLLLLILVFSSISVAQTPRYGGTLIVANPEITTLNPVWKYEAPSFGISQNIYSTLVITDYGITVGKGAYGDLAKSWDISPDGLTYTFHLHDNVYWHDGVKFSAEDVKFTYETAIEKKYPLAVYLKEVKEIITPDKDTVVFKLSKPSVTFLTMFAQASNWYGQIIAKHLYEGTDIPNNPYNKKPVGTGPFVFEEWQSGQFVSLKANEKYFRRRPYVDRVVWKLFTSKEPVQADFRAGKVHLAGWLVQPPMHEIKRLMAEPSVRVWRQISVYSHNLVFNHTRKPTNDIRVREAISLAIDRDEASNLAQAGLLKPDYNGSSVGMRQWTNFKVSWPKKDLKRAQKLLDEAGYPAGPDGVRMKLVTTPPEYYRDLTEVIVTQLKKVGIQVDIKLVDEASWFNTLKSGDFDINFYYNRYGPDPDAYDEHYGTGGARNFGKYSSPAVDKLFEEGRNTFDVAKRKQIYDKVQEILRKDFAFCPVTEHGYFELTPKWVHGNPIGDPETYGKSYGWGGYREVWFEKVEK